VNQLHSDWFIKAIESNGSVKTCLQAVLDDLNVKSSFIKIMMQHIGEPVGSYTDVLTDIGTRLRTLENTLRFRVAILSPDRKGAWFRASATTTGPFKEVLYSEPFFTHFDEHMANKVRLGLKQCWDHKGLVQYPFSPTETCLWKILLTLNFELERASQFGRPFGSVLTLGDQLPEELKSRSLLAFLSNVRAEVLSLQNRLGQCYKEMLDASERFWLVCMHETAQRDGRAHRHAKNQFDRLTVKPMIKAGPDFEALRFFGFDNFPDGEELKRRYHSLALRFHPDREGGSEHKFKLLAKHYRHLSKLIGLS
jgi:hypothetical protein